MKKLIIIAIAFVSLQTIAQEHQRPNRKEMKKEHFKDMSPEDLAQLKTKHMTLQLDLDEAQKNKVYNLVLEQAKNRKAKMEAMKDSDRKALSKEEKLKMANERLDAEIAFKKEMKSVLNEEQYKKFERSQAKNGKRKRGPKPRKRN